MGISEHFIIPLFVAGTLLLTIFVFFLIAYLLVQKHKQNQHQLEKQNMIFDAQKRILNARIEEQENTMTQISTELHDNISATLGLAQMNMYLVADTASDAKQISLIEKTNNLLTTTIDDLHNISHSLNSNFVKKLGLVEVLYKELDIFKPHKHINCSLNIVGEYESLGADKELFIYRIAQEALHNAIKYAKASEIKINLRYETGNFTMIIADNGIGFDKSKINEMKGLGFFNMFQRAKFINGRLDIQTLPLNGTTITLIIDGKREAN